MIKIAVPDLVSNSYFPVLAAVELGFMSEQGVEATVELISPLDDCVRALRDGAVDFIGASAHAPLQAFPEWQGVKLICSQSQRMYWFLVLRRELGIARGDLSRVPEMKIAAVPFVGLALRRLLVAAGVIRHLDDFATIVPEAARREGVNFGVAAVQALASGEVDGFFANGMGAELAVEHGIGSIVLDVRRGDGPEEALYYSQPTVATTDALIDTKPEVAAAMVHAVVRAQQVLRKDPRVAFDVGRKRFPPLEAQLIERLIARDAGFYDAGLPKHFIDSMCRYARDVGRLTTLPSYEEVVAVQFKDLWVAPN